MFLLYCFSPKQFPGKRLQETLALLNNLVHLVHNVKQHLKLDQVELLCRLLECSTTAIVLQKNGIDCQEEYAILEHENESDENLCTSYQLTDIPTEMLRFFRKQEELVESFISVKLPLSLEYSKVAEWNQELQVNSCVLCLNNNIKLCIINGQSRTICTYIVCNI